MERVDWTWPAQPVVPAGGVIIWTDGACWRNPGGTATFGYVVRRDGEHLHTGSGLVVQGDGASNNVAEMAAIYMALKWLRANPQDAPVVVRTDSQLAVNLVTGKWKPKKPHLIQHRADIWAVLRPLPNKPTFYWIPRDQNAEADAAAAKAYREITGKPIPVFPVR